MQKLPDAIINIIESNINPQFAPLLLAAPALLAALESLREDFRLLRDGEWQPDEDSISASIERADAATKNL